MLLRIALFAALRERMGRSEIEVDDLPEGLDMASLKQLMAERFPDLGDLTHVTGVVGTDYVGSDHILREGDQVALLPPVSGGDSAEDYTRGVFELSESAIDPGALSRRVSHPSCGAIVTFTGVTRETNRELEVARLDYEAFQAMTGPEMGRIFAECRAKFHADEEATALRMLCVHRIGTVEVEQPSIVIAVASPHRDSAFLAARFLIDTLKERLPVWKKEVYADGHHWIGDRS